MPTHSRTEVEGLPFAVVGVGASAGGLEAFTSLLENLPSDTGMAFVFVQHMKRDAKSMLTEILARSTSIPVVEASEGLEVRPDHVYVMAAATDLGISGGKLTLVPRLADAARHLPIDLFLKALAADQAEKAIGVILSGAGSDGAAGLTAIKGEGGVTLVQDPATAKHDDMPRHAIESGAADFVLDAAGVAAELARLGRHPYLREPAPVVPLLVKDRGEDLLRQIFLLLKRKTGTDFSGYKKATFNRRLARRMLLRRIENLEEYVRYLRETSEEVEALYQDVLITVTEFFRDPETFEYLKTDVFPRILAQKEPGEPLRVWVVGCSSGQEAYSLAIVLLEFLGENDTYPIQIFATDVNEKEVGRARAGLYPVAITQEVSSERLRRFFTETVNGYEVNRSVREMCTFATHDLTRDLPFSSIDLISCRNVLVYFDAVLQERVAPVFQYALRPGGYLVLGRAETLGRQAHLFELLDKRHHVYVKGPVASQLPLTLLLGGGTKPGSPAAETRSGPGPEKPLDSHDLSAEADRLLARAYAPVSVVIDEKYQVLDFRGPSASYLEHPTGKASFDVFQMAKEGLRYQLRRAVEEARKTMKPVRKASIRMLAEAERTVEIEVSPFTYSDGRTYFVISFREPVPARAKRKARGTGPTAEPQGVAADEAALLRKELEASREHLQSIISEKDVGTEELRAANEELQSANEELQSTNQELETAKEELQSINEELTIVNEELETRNTEIGRAHEDLSNLLASVNIPIVMLDDDLRIRRFTPGTEAVIRVISSDVGRPITDLDLKVIFPDLGQFLRRAIDSISASAREVQDEEGRWYSVRVRPSTTAAGRVEGAILSFVDVDELKRSLEATSEAKTELLQSQKMEAVGQLAGGVAHDFNNILTSIIGYSDLILGSEACAEASLCADVEEIKAAAERAGTLTRQILAFSRRQALQPEVLSLSDVIKSMEHLLGRTLGEDIELITLCGSEVGLVEVDTHQFGQVLVNLALNARDAMPSGGKLTLETINVELDRKDCQRLPGTTPGAYVMLAVSDSGVGMDEETKSHVFEPFFTTKEPGKGTGLGLATVYGVVKQSGGSIYVHSEPGQGTTFKVYLPRVDRPGKKPAKEVNSSDSVAGSETILVVEDEAALRELVRRVLERLGYTVLTVGSGDEALTLLEKADSRVDLLLTDVVLPGSLQGNELARAAGALWPRLPVLYMSGYARDTIVHSGRLDEGINYLAKPFTPDELAWRVRKILDSQAPSG